MITYKRCSIDSVNEAFEAFKIGFSDYIVKFNYSLDTFIERFFGPEGNSHEHSFIALDDNLPVGIILGGIREFDGVTTMRCGTLAIHPSYRGSGVSKELFKLHKEDAMKHKCKQLFLEVIVGNDRAINFYKNHGYNKVYDLSYFSKVDLTDLNIKPMDNEYCFSPISFEAFEGSYKRSLNVHINWQNQIDYFKEDPTSTYYGILLGDEIIGSICMGPNGRINFIWVDNNHRNNGIGELLIANVVKTQGLSKLAISFSNNSLLEGFVRHIGFNKDNISQYEMYLLL